MKRPLIVGIPLKFRIILFLVALAGCTSNNIKSNQSAPAAISEDIRLAETVDHAITKGLKAGRSGVSLTTFDKHYLMNAAHAVIKNYFASNRKPLAADDFPIPPENIISQSEKIYTTLLVNRKIRGCMSASKGNLLENTISAVIRTIEDERFGGPLQRRELLDTTIDFTFLLNPVPIEAHDLDKIEDEIELGIHAIGLRKDNKRAFYKSSVPITHSYSLKRTLQRLGKKAKIGSDAYKDPEAKIYKYSTIQFTENFSDRSLVDLHRSSPMFYQAYTTPQTMLNALRLCGDYMKNHVSYEGLMTYEYDAYGGKKENPISSTSVIRRLAGTWILAAIGNYLNDETYIHTAKKSLDYFIKRYYVYDNKQDFGYIKIKDDANLALAAFTLCAMVEIGDQQYRPKEKQQLINFILAMENKEQGFLYPVYLPDKETTFERKEVYYPGEALTALMLLYKSTKNSRYLAVAERVFDYYQNLYSRSSKKASMTPWMSKAYSAVFFATGNRKYADFVFKMNDNLLKSQRGTDQKYVDKIGSFFSSGSACSTAVMAESVLEAYRLAKALNDGKRQKAYRRSILMADRFILHCQYNDNNMFFVKNPKSALGGVRNSIYESKIRIDANQHAGCALLKTLQYVYDF